MTTHWFEGAVQPDVVGPHVIRSVPEFATGELLLLGCRISRIRSTPADGTWTAIYELDVRDAASGQERTVAASGNFTPPGVALPAAADALPFGAEGWNVQLVDLRLHLWSLAFDHALPGLGVISDPDQAFVLLGELLGGTTADAPRPTVTSCAATVVDHKPGVRATVVCRLEYADALAVPELSENAPATVVVKVHHGDEGRRGHEAMLALSAAAWGSSRVLGLAEPLGYSPDLLLSVQGYVDHHGSLKDLFHRAFGAGSVASWDELLQAMTVTGAALAELHRCDSTYGHPVTVLDELALLQSKHGKLAAATGWLDHGLALDRIEAAANAAPEDPLGPAHHSFRPAQVLLTESTVAFIDFDKFCQAEAACDIAALTIKLQHMGMNKIDGDSHSPADRELRLAELREAFLDEYRRTSAVSAARLAVWEALELFSLVLSAAKKMNRSRMDSCVLMLERHLQAHGL